MFQVFDVKGHMGGECYLVLFDQCSVLIDTGLDFCAKETVENIKKHLRDDCRLDMVLLTHSHYDHASGAAYIKRAFPETMIVAGEYAANVFKKENARKTIRNLNEIFAQRIGYEYEDDNIDALAVDKTVNDGDILQLPGTTVRVLDARGHTNCCLCYYFVEEGLLAACETHGLMFVFPQVLPGNVVSCSCTLDSLARAKDLHPKHILLPHFGLLPDGAIDLFFENAEKAVIDAKEFIVRDFENGYTLDEIIKDCKSRYYTKECAVLQPEDAFLLNAKHMVLKTVEESGFTFPADN